jgi:hypothetical protein
MHKTEAGERRKAMERKSRELARDAKIQQKAAKTLTEARWESKRLQEESNKAHAEAEVLKLQARLEDLNVWQMERVKSKKKYLYWMAAWREGDKVRTIHLGSCKKLSRIDALHKARKLKAEALGLRP